MKFFTWIMCFVLCNFQLSTAFYNIYMHREESFKILGLNVELYYVKEGKVNDYALGFVVPVPQNITQLEFTWQSLRAAPLPYSLEVLTNNQEALIPPSFDIPSRGNIPTSKQIFVVYLSCTGRVSAEVEVKIVINITVSPTNTTTININRKKICFLDESMINEVHEVHEVQDNYLDRSLLHEKNSSTVIMDAATVIIPDRNPIIVAIGGATAVMIVVLMLLSTVCYVQSKKIRNNPTPPPGSIPGSKYLEWTASHATLKSTSNGYGVVTSTITPIPGQKFLRVGSPVCSTVASYSSFRKATPVVPSNALLCSSAFLASSTNDCSASVIAAANSAAILTEQIAELAIDRDSVIFQRILQEGTYGQVHHGMMSDQDSNQSQAQAVVVKTVKELATSAQISNFLTDGMMLVGMHHANVLPIIGACIENSSQPLLVYPYMSEGNLKSFLRRSQFSTGTGVSNHCISTQDLVDMAVQIAEGIVYLHRRYFLHKDIATRNCVVDDRLHVKITDNALARDLFPDDYHCLGDNEIRPIRWMALESLIQKEFTPASDLWQFGVLLWELMTLGQQPYAQVDPFEQVRYLQNGYRLSQPLNCPDELYDVMDRCWSTSPSDRLTFPQLLRILASFYNHLGSFI